MSLTKFQVALSLIGTVAIMAPTCAVGINYLNRTIPKYTLKAMKEVTGSEASSAKETVWGKKYKYSRRDVERWTKGLSGLTQI